MADQQLIVRDEDPEIRKQKLRNFRLGIRSEEPITAQRSMQEKEKEEDRSVLELDENTSLYYIPETTIQGRQVKRNFQQLACLSFVFNDQCMRDGEKNLEKADKKSKSKTYALELKELASGYNKDRNAFIVLDPNPELRHKEFALKAAEYAKTAKLDLKIEYAKTKEDYDKIINRYKKLEEKEEGFNVTKIRMRELSPEQVRDLQKNAEEKEKETQSEPETIATITDENHNSQAAIEKDKDGGERVKITANSTKHEVSTMDDVKENPNNGKHQVIHFNSEGLDGVDLDGDGDIDYYDDKDGMSKRVEAKESEAEEEKPKPQIRERDDDDERMR